MDGWIDRWIDGWIDGWSIYACLYVCTCMVQGRDGWRDRSVCIYPVTHPLISTYLPADLPKISTFVFVFNLPGSRGTDHYHQYV
jgi:hypothetical protein